MLLIQQGSLYPALHRLERRGWIKAKWGTSENNRRAKYYELTKAGRKQLELEKDSWKKLAAAVAQIQRRRREGFVFNDLIFRLRALFRREIVESEADAELRFHFEQQVEKNIKAGLTREEALRRARIDFGGHEQLKEEIREARGVNLIETLFQDVRYGLRILGRTPVITGVAILSLALGIGANTAIFSLIDSLVLRTLPVKHPEELVRSARQLLWGRRGHSKLYKSLWEQLRDHQAVFSGVFAWDDALSIWRRAERSKSQRDVCERRLFQHSGCRPPPDDYFPDPTTQRGCAGVAVLSYGFWQEHLEDRRAR